MKSNDEICKTVLATSIVILLVAQFIASNAKTSDFALKGALKEVAANQSSEVNWWPMFGHDLRHTSFSLSTAPHKPNLLWKFNSTLHDASWTSSPAVASGMVFVGSTSDGSIYGLNETDGILIWKYRTNGSISSSPAVADGNVFVGSEDGSVYSLNATSGALIWKYTTDGTVHYSSPAVVNGRLFIGISWYAGTETKGYLYSLNATNGALIWQFRVFRNVYSSPAVADGRVFVGGTGSGAGRIYSLNETTGELLWTYITGDHVGRSSPAIADGKVFIGSLDHKVYALDEFTGSLIWSYTASSWVDSSPAVADNRVLIASEDGNIYCLNETTGVKIWTYQTERPVPYQIISSPAVADGMVFINSQGPEGLMALNETTGTLLWKYVIVIPNDTTSSPAVANGKIFIGYSEGICSIGSPHSLTINPTFKDNTGYALDPPPSSWSILFPNGTVRIVFSPSATYPQVSTGNYSIISIVWQGIEVVPETPPRIFVASDTIWTPGVNCRLPTQLTIALSTSTSYIGFKVNIGGRLFNYKNTSIAGAMVVLKYSATGGEPWTTITADNTKVDGGYSIIWMPSATGNYLVKATWTGNSTYPGTTIVVNLAVIPFQEQNVFSVTSNSTISALAFNSSSLELSFTVSGEIGTRGYVKVTIAKSLISNIADVKVYLDGNQTEYSVTSQDDAWILIFTYTHSTRHVTIDLKPASITGIPPELTPWIYLMTALIVIALLSGIAIIKRSKQKPSQEEPVVSSGAP